MNTASIFSFLSFGYEGTLVKVEVDLKNGLPMTEIIGLPGNAVKESRERVRVAIKNSGFDFPQKRILINLSPASEKKDGAGFDLPIALSLLLSMRNLDAGKKIPVLVLGELELSGAVRPVSGVLAGIFCGLQAGITTFIVPAKSTYTSSALPPCKVFGINNLPEALSCLDAVIQGDESEFTSGTAAVEVSDKKSITGSSTIVEPDCRNTDTYSCVHTEVDTIRWSPFLSEYDYTDVRGQIELVSALEIAAVGGHNLLAYGPPGCGKSLALSRFQQLLPDLDIRTAREVSRIYSIAGLNTVEAEEGHLLYTPPFRMPHQSASLEGIIGGAGKCLPGEISLAHGGVLFLDEANQFKVSVLQSLRAPLETGTVTLSRAERRTTYPSRFQVLLALNPCPCGNAGSPNRFCTCSPQVLDRFWKRLTAPLLDRIDLRCFVLPPSRKSLLEPSPLTTAYLRKRITSACSVQYERNMFYSRAENDTQMLIKNAHLAPELVSKICALTEEAARLFYAYARTQTSGRASHAILKVARTISDLECSEKINSAELEKAILLRKLEDFLPEL